jgi:Fic family protein
VALTHERVHDDTEVLLFGIRAEEDPRVLAVLGHFIFTFIHPYMDGNGRSGRFMMNTMLSSGGYPWTIIPVTKRRTYMEALETASVQMDIRPFTRFVVECMKVEHTPNTAEPELPSPRMG